MEISSGSVPRLSRIAAASLILGIAAPALPFLCGLCASPFVHSPSILLFMTARVGFYISPVGSVAAFAAGLVALRHIRHGRGLLRGTALAVVALVVSVSCVAFLRWRIAENQVAYANYLRKEREQRTAPVVLPVFQQSSTALRVPPGFLAKEGTTAEPYTDTGWAREVIHEKTGIEMVFIPAGEFQMGSPETDKERGRDEGPVHTVRITGPFYLGKYEVTQSQWQKLMGGNPSWFAGDRNPVEDISWNDCGDFLGRAGDGLRLPTEAQWEYACRAGSRSAYHFGAGAGGLSAYQWYRYSYSFVDGAGDLSRHGWYSDNSDGKTHPVGQKQPNAWGLYDMHGNVWEWCEDWYDGEYYQRSPLEDPRGPSSDLYRVLRGGSWLAYPDRCRSAYRAPSDSEPRPDSGLRVARTLD